MRHTKLKQVSQKQVKELRLRSKTKKEKLVKTGGVCPECNHPPDFRGLHLSHEELLSAGGKTTKKNTKIKCARCHIDKGHLGERKQVKAKPAQPAPLQLSGYHSEFHPYSRDVQVGKKAK